MTWRPNRAGSRRWFRRGCWTMGRIPIVRPQDERGAAFDGWGGIPRGWHVAAVVGDDGALWGFGLDYGGGVGLNAGV